MITVNKFDKKINVKQHENFIIRNIFIYCLENKKEMYAKDLTSSFNLEYLNNNKDDTLKRINTGQLYAIFIRFHHLMSFQQKMLQWRNLICQ